MKQPKFSARRDMFNVMNDSPSIVTISGTKKRVKIRGIKPYTIECLTKLWLERDAAQAEDSAGVLKSLCIEPYFSVKQACLFVLNDYWKIKMLYPIMWRLWGKLWGFTEEQMEPIIVEGKKKLPLTAHWRNMASSVDMRMDWMKMTKKEAEQYRAELLSVAKALSLKSSQNTEKPNGE